MTPSTTVMTVRVPDDLMAAIVALHARDGIPAAEQVRRALASWLAEKEVYVPTREQKAYNLTKPRKTHSPTKSKRANSTKKARKR